jgi:predicted nucleic acid-binding protein
MIVYVDSSALVKRYVVEADSERVATLLRDADAIGTSVITRVEVAAALGRAARGRIVSRAVSLAAVRALNEDWDDLTRIPINEPLAARGADLAVTHGLRGYDAVHLACALKWREDLDRDVTLATYDRELWNAATICGLRAWPTTSK